jgi:hypothetical protein
LKEIGKRVNLCDASDQDPNCPALKAVARVPENCARKSRGKERVERRMNQNKYPLGGDVLKTHAQFAHS